jgi:hypothetical protein
MLSFQNLLTLKPPRKAGAFLVISRQVHTGLLEEAFKIFSKTSDIISERKNNFRKE